MKTLPMHRPGVTPFVAGRVHPVTGETADEIAARINADRLADDAWIVSWSRVTRDGRESGDWKQDGRVVLFDSSEAARAKCAALNATRPGRFGRTRYTWGQAPRRLAERLRGT